MSYRFLTWNIQSGGGKRIPEQLIALQKLSPDYVTLTEFTAFYSDEWKQAFAKIGLTYFYHAAGNDTEKAIAIASRWPFEVKQSQFDEPQRMIEIYLSTFNLRVINIHIPGAVDHKFKDGVGISGKKRKVIFWETLLDTARRYQNSKLIIMGDFNTGLKADTQGTAFRLSIKMEELNQLKFVDSWRYLNPRTHDYTWFSQRKVNGVTIDYHGFRLDYIYLSPTLKHCLKNATIRHEERLNKLSDHAIIFVDMALDARNNSLTNSINSEKTAPFIKAQQKKHRTHLVKINITHKNPKTIHEGWTNLTKDIFWFKGIAGKRLLPLIAKVTLFSIKTILLFIAMLTAVTLKILYVAMLTNGSRRRRRRKGGF